MLVIRMQRVGRKGHAQFRVVVQDSRRTPTSGRVVASLGHFNPHTKEGVIDKEKASFYLEHGAQPTDRVARLLKDQGIKLPSWVKLNTDKKRAIRNPEKLRRNRPAEEQPEETVAEEAPAEEAPAEETEAPAETEAPEQPAETPAEAEEKPAE